MAVTVSQNRKTVPGDAFRVTALINGDTSYPTGGYLITPQALGFSQYITDIIRCDATNLASGVYVPVITPTYGDSTKTTIVSIQFQLEQYAVAAEVAAATNVSAALFLLLVEGR